MQVELQIREGEDEYVDALLNDKANDLYGVMYATSMFIGPLLGSSFATSYSYATACDIFAVINFVWMIVLFLFNCGPTVVYENKVFQQALKQLKTADDGKEQADANSTSYVSGRHYLGTRKAGKSHYNVPNKASFVLGNSYNDARRN